MRLLFAAAIFLITLTGCTQQPDSSLQQQQQQSAQQTEQTMPPKPEINDPAAVSERLEQLAESIPRVRNANCVVIGNTAIVGIDVDENLDRSRIGTVKYSVAEALRKDPYGVHAIVTADMDLRARVQKLRQAIAEGRPLSGFSEELADLIGRVMPQLPKQTVPIQPDAQNAPANEDPMEHS